MTVDPTPNQGSEQPQSPPQATPPAATPAATPPATPAATPTVEQVVDVTLPSPAITTIKGKQFFDDIYAQNETRFLAELKEFLAYQSISTDPKYHQQCLSCANWLADHLTSIGVPAEILETTGKPVVFAERPGKPDRPTILFYGHYDVQPVDPLEKWTTPPFDAEIREGRLYARGAQDNKGQLFYAIKAIEQLVKHDLLDCTMKFVIEGEEESGGDGLHQCIERWGDKLQADILMVCDTGTENASSATVTMGLRGIAHLDVTLKGPKTDLHSGSHGGMVANPALELARLLATLHNADGSIAIKDYYKNIPEIDAEDRALANAAPFDLAAYQTNFGIQPDAFKQCYTPAERRGFRPTIEISGMQSGYNGPGCKTIIPASATAKITARLVKGQDPDESLQMIVQHLKDHCHPSLTIEISNDGAEGPALSLCSKSPLIQKAKGVLDIISESHTYFSWEGGSIPVVSTLAASAHAEPLLVGFGLDEDNIHAPNESFSLNQFKKGFEYVSMMLNVLSDKP